MQAIPDLACQVKPVGDEQGQRHRNRESPGSQHEDPAVETAQVYLVAGHEQQETQAQVSSHLDSRVEMHPPENRGSDQDTAEDLQHHRGYLHSRDEPEQQRHGDGHPADDQQAVERDHDRPGKRIAGSLAYSIFSI